ncbi:NADH-quinone oxidoreductase subunit NuoB [Roseomonas sp. KE0001]|nr:NADH-quinone oxidoreductase subunit NuoB [Roseomonas sp. KE0001]
MLWPRMLRGLRRPLTDPAPAAPEATVAALSERLEQAARRRLGRSLAIRHVDSGSCNGCELELNALHGAVYDLERFGLRFVASPRHADVLLATGPASRNMVEALLRTHAAMPEPKWVVAVGDCALGGGLFAGSYAVADGVDAVLPVDLVIPGCPPSPTLLLEGLLALLGAQREPPPAAPPPRAEPRLEEGPEEGPEPPDEAGAPGPRMERDA